MLSTGSQEDVRRASWLVSEVRQDNSLGRHTAHWCNGTAFSTLATNGCRLLRRPGGGGRNI